MFSAPSAHGTEVGFVPPIQHIVFPSPVPRIRHARSGYAPHTSPFAIIPRKSAYGRNYCHFMRLTLELRLAIYELTLDTNTPRQVLLSKPAAWKEKHLTQSEKIQHASTVLDVITKGSEGKNDLRYDFKLRQHSSSEVRALAQALWPVTLTSLPRV